jgi:hypothetical protein
VSSAYYLLCLSHDPALVLDHDFGCNGIKALSTREHDVHGEHDVFARHPECDLVAGRYSYPLIEVGCFGRQLPGPTGCRGHHNAVDWTEATVLRLLSAASGKVDEKLIEPFTCWPANRLAKLRCELGR